MNLLNIPLLSTAIAIVISWALYALFCSYTLEGWVQIKAERGRFMKNYLFLQLKDHVNGINWADRLYSHGTIDLLSRDDKKPTNDISEKLFAQTLIEVVGSAHLVQSQVAGLRAQGKLKAQYQSPLLGNFSDATQILNPSDLVSLFRQALSTAESKASSSANGLVNEAEIFNHLSEYLEGWFTELSGRLTLWYKKRTRERLFYLGTLIALLINVDSIELFSFYEDNPAAKTAVIQYYKEHPEVLVAAADTSAAPAAKGSLKDSQEKFTMSIDTLLNKTKIPVGWSNNLFIKSKEMDVRHHWERLLYKILGILISGFAASFGAPFWFDLLKKATLKS